MNKTTIIITTALVLGSSLLGAFTATHTLTEDFSIVSNSYYTYTSEQVEQAVAENGFDDYNDGYRRGMLYAYDNVVVCGASPEAEGLSLSKLINGTSGDNPVSSISCGE